MAGSSVLKRCIAIGIVVLLWPLSAVSGSWPASRTRVGTTAVDITLTKNGDLSFGELISGGSAGAVVVSPTGARTATGGVTLGNSAGASAASFTVGGDPSALYSITLPASTTLVSGGNTMTVTSFLSNPSGSGQLSGSGTQTLTIGATLQVDPNQASGSYSGSFSVTVTYN